MTALTPRDALEVVRELARDLAIHAPGADDAAHDRCIEALAVLSALVERAGEPVAWMPIETAPKDGTLILLYAPPCEYQGRPVDERITCGHWMDEYEHLEAEFHGTTGEYLGQFPTGKLDDAMWMSWDGGFSEDFPPTLWQPLPNAPGASHER